MLEIDTLDWHLLENGEHHHTDRYEILQVDSTPVLRRAQPFKLSITFKNRSFNEQLDRVTLLFNHEKSKAGPRLQALTEITSITSATKISNSKTVWSLQLESQHNKKITILVRSPSTAAWGVWNLKIKIGYKLESEIITWASPEQFWLLFNPWMKDDEVYMPETKYLDEYILNDVGKVYTRGAGKPTGMKWIYGQFAAPVIKVLKNIFDDNKLSTDELGSPISISRNLSSLYDIVKGRWEGSYEDGTAPWLWTGSVPIYEEYLTTGLTPKYAQCFVYAGILTTALRAVGIPSRNITNFLSSAGGESTMCLSTVYNTSGEVVEQGPKIWNFHVWNDAWMARHDLPPGYGGWQAVDCEGLGPAPLEAVRRGEVKLSHDVADIMSACNADRARWIVDSQGEHQLIKVDTSYMGRSMLTKQPFIYDPHGDTDFQDVVRSYKEPEGSKEERMAVYNAVKYCKKFYSTMIKLDMEDLSEEDRERYLEYLKENKPLYHIDMPEDESRVKFQLEEIVSVPLGENIQAVLKIENSGDTEITVEACLRCISVYYNGAKAGQINKQNKSTAVEPKSKGAISVVIEAEEYAAKLVEFSLLSISCLATVKQSNYTWANDFQLNVDTPEIVITSKGDLELEREGILLFQFKNHLKTKLTKCSMTYEAPGVGRNVKISCRDVRAGEQISIEHRVKPTSSGQIPINAIFTSKELNFLGGSSVLQVN